MIDVCENNDQGNYDNADEQTESQVDKVTILAQTLSMLKEIHSNGAKLCDNVIMLKARDSVLISRYQFDIAICICMFWWNNACLNQLSLCWCIVKSVYCGVNLRI